MQKLTKIHISYILKMQQKRVFCGSPYMTTITIVDTTGELLTTMPDDGIIH